MENGTVKRLRRLLLLVVFVGCSSVRDPGRTFALRLHPGDDLRLSLERLAVENRIQAGYVATCVGSLKQVGVRYADRTDSVIVDGPWEIVALGGTLSLDGPHLHISVADAEGRRSVAIWLRDRSCIRQPRS
jgi:predicted DNA-binding protein with PD1-like motif